MNDDTYDQWMPIVIVWPLAIFLFCLLASGCAKSETRETVAIEKQDRIGISGTITVPTSDGPKAVPVAFTIDRTGSEDRLKESQTKTGVDGEAIGRSVAAALAPILAAQGGGMGWMSILSGIGGAATVATTGYLAIAKHKQMKPRRDA